MKRFKTKKALFSRGMVFFICLMTGMSVLILGRVYLRPSISRETLSSVLRPYVETGSFPSEINLPVESRQKESVKGFVQYSFDFDLQSTMSELFERYRPDYGAFVAIDPKTGRVLSLLSYEAKEPEGSAFVLQATFPSASVFKVITAAAAIEQKRFSAESIIPFNGAYHTLYRRNVLSDQKNRWTREMTLKEAFARSVNTVFAKLGAFTVGSEELRVYAERFGFNRKLSSEIPAEKGKVIIPQDIWGLAETASGFTKDTTMSPLQGALIAAAVENGGKMMEPYFIESARDRAGMLVYQSEPREIGQAVDPETASELKELMRETLIKGTASHTFRGFFKRDFAEAEAGGKTGSLSGDHPPGKYDWFVGFAHLHGQRIAVAVLTVHKEYWRVKSSYLARRAFESYLTKHSGKQSASL